MKLELPLVSIVIPVRNEMDHIKQCLDSILYSDYPRENLEVIVVDGVSEDQTQGIIAGYARKHPFISILDNPERVTSVAFNKGILHSKGDIIALMSGHAYYERDNISRCVKHMEEGDIDSTGGICITLPGKDSLVARGIALVLSSPFGVGNAYFRIGTGKPRYVDTVPFGFYKKKIFEDICRFNEKLIRNQDVEFNARIGKNGGKILLDPEIKSYYFARPTLRDLWIQNWRNGIWNIYVTKLSPGSLSIRHFVPMFFLLGLIGIGFLSLFLTQGLVLLGLVFGSYLLASLVFSLKIGLREGLRYIPLLPAIFFSHHLSYGLGMLWGTLTNWRFPWRGKEK